MTTTPTKGRLYTLSPRDRTGFLGLGGRQVLVLGSAVVVGVLLASQARTVALGIWPLAGASILSFLRVGGIPVVDAMGPAAVFLIRQMRGRTRWSAAAAAKTSAGLDGHGGLGERPVPPPLDDMQVFEVDGDRYHPGAAGTRIAIAHDPVRRTYAATVRATGMGGEPFALTETPQQEYLLDRWGEALAGFCQERSPVAWIRWAESATPAGNAEQLAYLDQQGIDDLSDPAVTSYRAVLDEAGPLAMRHEVLVTVAVAAQRVPARARTSEEGHGASRTGREAACIDALLGQLRLFVERLEGAGLLVSSPLAVDELDAAMASRMSHRASMDIAPAESPMSLLAHLRAWRAGVTRAAAPTQWAPKSAESRWQSWVVDGVYHRAYHVAEWPRFELPAAWMAPLMVWGSGRRTVAVILEPVPVRASHRAIERQATKLESDRVHRESKGFRVPAHHRRASRAVAEREEELVAGFAELEFAGLVCISAPSAADLERRSAALQQVAIACGLDLEPLAGRHDLGVAACLPTACGLARTWAA